MTTLELAKYLRAAITAELAVLGRAKNGLPTGMPKPRPLQQDEPTLLELWKHRRSARAYVEGVEATANVGRFGATVSRKRT